MTHVRESRFSYVRANAGTAVRGKHQLLMTCGSRDDTSTGMAQQEF